MRVATISILLLATAAFAAAPAGAAPRLGRTAEVKALKGKVLLKVRGAKSFARLRGTRTIPIGSTLDTSAGTVRVTTARNNKGATQYGEFHDGMFTIAQSKSDPTTELRLTGEPACSAGVSAAASRRRRLVGNAHGRFSTRGRQSTATVRGTEWITEDLCGGSTLTTAVRGGDVAAKSKASSKLLKPGQSSEDYCSDNGFPGVSDLYCMSLFSDPKTDTFGFALVTFDPGALGVNPPSPNPPRETEVCIKNPQGAQVCHTYPLEDIGGSWLQSDGCSPASGPGAYPITWRLQGHDLPVPLTYHSKHDDPFSECVNGGTAP